MSFAASLSGVASSTSVIQCFLSVELPVVQVLSKCSSWKLSLTTKKIWPIYSKTNDKTINLQTWTASSNPGQQLQTSFMLAQLALNETLSTAA